jgi:hypothetical protein
MKRFKFGQIVVSDEDEHPLAQLNEEEAVVITSNRKTHSGDKTLQINKSDVTGGFKIHIHGSYLSKRVIENDHGRIIGHFTHSGKRKLFNFSKNI